MCVPASLGRYRLGGVLGEGRTSVVCTAVDPLLDRRVAIKVATARAADSAVTAFLDRATLTAGLSHPGIVTTYDAGRDADHAWLVMELLDGPTLDPLIASPVPSTDRRRRLILAAHLVEALTLVHAAGIIHADISPANVMVRRTGRPVLIDFGQAHRVGDHAPERPAGEPVVGTPAFLAPEVVRGHPTTVASEVYAASGLVFALLVGRPPFPDRALDRQVQAHLGQPPPSVLTLAPELPAELDLLLLQGLAKDPRDRPTTVEPLAQALRRAATGLGTTRNVAPARDAATSPRATIVGSEPTPWPPGAPRTRTRELPVVAAARAMAARSGPSPQPRHAGRRRLSAGALVLLVAASGASGWALGASRANGPDGARPAGSTDGQLIPVVAGQSVEQAGAVLRARGVPVVVQSRRDAAFPAGEVVGTEPPAGAAASPGAAVTVIVSTGPILTRVPQLLGGSLGEARKVLQDNGLALGEITRRHSPKPLDTVLAAYPAAGAEVPTGTIVRVELATGATVMPDLRQLSVTEASSRVAGAGLVIAVQRVARSGHPADTVLSAFVAAGSVVQVGSTVTVVATEASVPEPSTTPTPTPTPSPVAPPTQTG